MSNQIFKSINNAIEFYENRLFNPNNIHLMMFPSFKRINNK